MNVYFCPYCTFRYCSCNVYINTFIILRWCIVCNFISTDTEMMQYHDKMVNKRVKDVSHRKLLLFEKLSTTYFDKFSYCTSVLFYHTLMQISYNCSWLFVVICKDIEFIYSPGHIALWLYTKSLTNQSE